MARNGRRVLTALLGTVWALEAAMSVTWKDWCLRAATQRPSTGETPPRGSALTPVVTEALKALPSPPRSWAAPFLPVSRKSSHPVRGRFLVAPGFQLQRSNVLLASCPAPKLTASQWRHPGNLMGCLGATQ